MARHVFVSLRLKKKIGPSVRNCLSRALACACFVVLMVIVKHAETAGAVLRQAAGWEVVSLDIVSKFEPTILCDIALGRPARARAASRGPAGRLSTRTGDSPRRTAGNQSLVLRLQLRIGPTLRTCQTMPCRLSKRWLPRLRPSQDHCLEASAWAPTQRPGSMSRLTCSTWALPDRVVCAWDGSSWMNFYDLPFSCPPTCATRVDEDHHAF